MKKNYGALLERSVRSSGFNISTLARRLKVSRSTIYAWFNLEDLDTLTIVKIEYIMKVNSVQKLEERYGLRERGVRDHANMIHTSEQDDQLELWMQRYVALLEDYNWLLINKKS